MPNTEILITTAIGVGALVILVALAVSWLRRRQATRIGKLNDEISEIVQTGTFDQRLIGAAGGPAFGRLESTVNNMLAALSDKNDEIREREELFQNLAETVPQMILVHRNEILYANAAAADLLGLDRNVLVGKRLADLVPADHRAKTMETTAKRLAGQEVPPRNALPLINGSEKGLMLESAGRLIEYRGRPAVLEIAVQAMPPESELQTGPSLPQAQVTLESITEGVITTNIAGEIDYMNNAAEQLTGANLSTAAGRKLIDIISLVDESDRRSLGDPVGRCIAEGRRINLGRRALMLSHNGDEEFSVELTASPMRSSRDEISGAVVVLHDVSELRGLTRQMSYQASHDALTGLINRREFERRLDESLQSAHTGDAGHVLCYLDLDRFKVVNDTCGHMAGDSMLREVAGLIRDKIRDSDTVARIGGDEFGMLLIGCPLDKARQIADDVVAAIKGYRFVWRNKIFNIGVSIGIIEIGHEAGSLEDALSAADSACYVAKKRGRGQVHVYSARDEAVARHRGEIQWLQRLQGALKHNRFELYSQPIVSLSGRVSRGPAFEILLRLHDESGNEISPRDFMQAAERYQLMTHVDRWVVQTAMAALGRGALKLPDERSISINLSGQTLGDEQFLEFVVECLDQTGVSPGQICFEINETSVITNISHASRFIEVLHGMGCEFALDNFGSGLGSLANLKNLSMDYLKIDGSYIRDLDTDSVNQAMVSTMIKLAKTMKFKVVAEHVEDRGALDAVREMGVDFVQGYSIGRPEPLQSAA